MSLRDVGVAHGSSLLLISVLTSLAAVNGDTVACDCSRDVLTVGGEPNDGGFGGQGGTIDPLPDGAVFASPIAFAIDWSQVQGKISPLVYGLQVSHAGTPDEVNRYTLMRYASFWISTYNWEINAGNPGETWCWENGPFFGEEVTGDAVTRLFLQTRSLGAVSLLPVPIGPYVAADTIGGSGPTQCKGDVRLSPDYLRTRFRINQAAKAAPLSSTPNITDGVVSQDEFAAWARARAGGQKVAFMLDFLPERWHGIFADLHPIAVTYAEFVTRNITFARAVKKVYPGAEVVASTVVGWSGVNNLNWATDATDGGFFFNYFLRSLREANEREGSRVIDTLAIDWGPTLSGVMTESDLRQARLQSPRSLWDPTYDEKTSTSRQLGGAVKLIPRLKALIGSDSGSGYPGTKLAFNSWSFGSGETIDGGLLVADGLGILGRDGAHMAVLEDALKPNSFSGAGFRAFRNYDGKGSAFGDLAIKVVNADPARASIYASTDSAIPDRTVVVVINKTAEFLPVSLDSSNGPAFSTASVYRLTAAAPAMVPDPSPLALSGGQLRDRLPPYSIAVYVPAP